jgi:hypothetical protein
MQLYKDNRSNTEPYRVTTIFEKLLTSLINVCVAFLFLIPFCWAGFEGLELKLIFIGLFFLENLVPIIFFDYRLPGMLLQGTYWKMQYPKRNQLVHAILYTASFSTMLFWIWFPGDILLINLTLLQLPCVLFSGTTLHGLLAGNMVDIKRIKITT